MCTENLTTFIGDFYKDNNVELEVFKLMVSGDKVKITSENEPDCPIVGCIQSIYWMNGFLVVRLFSLTGRFFKIKHVRIEKYEE